MASLLFRSLCLPALTSAKFLADFRQNLVKGDKGLEDKLLLDQWVYQPGLPANVAKPDPAAFAEVDKAVAAFSAGGPTPKQFTGWTTAERMRFINSLPRKLPEARLAELDSKLGLSKVGNNEVLFAWLDLAVENHYQPAVPALENFLTVQGRRKFVKPLITTLAGDPAWGRPIAARIYAKTRASYHPVTTHDLDELGLIAAQK